MPRASKKQIDQLLGDALDCLKGETPEDMTRKGAKQVTVDRLTKYLRYGEIE